MAFQSLAYALIFAAQIVTSWPVGPCRLAPWSFVCDTDICEKISAFWTTEVIPGPLTFVSDTQNGCLHGLLLPLGQANIRFKCLGTVKGVRIRAVPSAAAGAKGLHSGVSKMEKMQLFKVLPSHWFFYCHMQCH